MQTPSQELRTCDSCQNKLLLNMFRPDGNICRYCEAGIKIPKHLLSSSGLESTQVELTPESKQISEDSNIEDPYTFAPDRSSYEDENTEAYNRNIPIMEVNNPDYSSQ